MKSINNLSCEVGGLGDISLVGEVTQFDGEFWAGLQPLMIVTANNHEWQNGKELSYKLK